MSLFEKLGMMTMSSREDEYSDIDLFIGLMKDIEEDPDKNHSEFFDVLTDSRRACVSGSAVLGKRLNKKDIAKDIDIFVDDRDKTFQKILTTFFQRDNVKNIIWPLYQTRTKESNKEKDNFVNDSTVIETSSSDYDFNIESYELNTFQIRLGPHILLNFILLKDASNKRKAGSSVVPEWAPSELSSNRPFNDIYLRELAAKRFITSQEEMQNYTSYVLEYISNNFDFQELKYIYDFKSKTCIHIYQSTSDITNLLIDKLTTIESNSFTDNLMRRLGGAKINLLEQLDKDTERFNDPETVTVASGFHQRYFDIASFDVLDKEQVMVGNNFTETAKNFTSLSMRVKHYHNKGFKIDDPDNILVDLHIGVCAVALGSLVDPIIHNLERQSIFNSNPNTKKKYLFLNRLKGIVEKNEDHLGLSLIRPLVEEESKPAVVKI